jgi:hypothetical protein
MAEAPSYDFDLEQGTSYREHIALEDADGQLVDLSGWTWQMHAKPIAAQAPTDPVAFSFTWELLDEAISIDGVDYPPNTVVLVTLEPEDTRHLDVGDSSNDEASQYRYDFDGIDTLGDKHRLRKGIITIHRDIRPTAEVP